MTVPAAPSAGMEVMIYNYLRQGEWWKPKERPPILVTEMGDRWRGNAVRWMERRAAWFEMLYSLGEIYRLLIPVGHDVVAYIDGRDILGDAVSFGDLISEDAADEMLLDQERRSDDPVSWIRTTTLYQALVEAGIDDRA